MENGVVTGEICNRDNCKGIISEHQKEGSCSCHINPPCGYCTTDNYYCPVCNWAGAEEIYNDQLSAKEIELYRLENEMYEKQRKAFYDKYAGILPIEKLEMRTEGHTHFSQKVIGVFPKETETRSSIYEKAKGTFGGRFEYFGDYNFRFIAYTD